jgi:hypothetical protein
MNCDTTANGIDVHTIGALPGRAVGFCRTTRLECIPRVYDLLRAQKNFFRLLDMTPRLSLRQVIGRVSIWSRSASKFGADGRCCDLSE